MNSMCVIFTWIISGKGNHLKPLNYCYDYMRVIEFQDKRSCGFYN